MARTVADAAAEVRDDTFLSMLSEADRAELYALGTRDLYAGGHTLILEGGPGTHVLIFSKGWAKAVTMTRAGREVVLRIYGPGDVVGGEPALTGSPRPESVICISTVRALRIGANRFNAVLKQSHSASRALSVVMQHRLEDAARRSRSRAENDTARLAGLLYELASRYGVQTQGGKISIPIPLSQAELASWVGDSRETIARVLRGMRNDGVIWTGYRSITVTDLPRLREHAVLSH